VSFRATTAAENIAVIRDIANMRSLAVMDNIQSTQNIAAILNLEWTSGSTRSSGHPIELAIRK
jgi:hypothetical protein